MNQISILLHPKWNGGFKLDKYTMRRAQIKENKHRGSKDEENLRKQGRIYKKFRDLRRIELVKLDRKGVLLTAAETLTWNPNAEQD